MNYAEIVRYLIKKLLSVSLQAILIAHFRYIKILTQLRGLTDQLALIPLSRIPKRDLSVRKPQPNTEI